MHIIKHKQVNPDIMKRALFLFLVIAVYMPLRGQTIVNKPNIEVNLIPSYEKFNDSSKRYLLDLYLNKKKKLKRSSQLQVIGFMNNTKGFLYDSYIINYSAENYCISKNDVTDNSLIDEENKKLNNAYLKLSENCEYLLAKYNKEYYALMDLIKDSIDYYNLMKIRSSQRTDSVLVDMRNKAKDSLNRQYNKWYNSLSPNGKKSVKLFNINNFWLDSPNSAGGCDVNFYYTNLSDKTIKYLYWYGFAKNAVNDVVNCDIRNRSSFSGKDTGPVEAGEKGGGLWENMIYNYSARELVLTSIVIYYMDGTSFSIGRNDIKLLENKPDKDISTLPFIANNKYQNYLKKSEDKYREWRNIEKILLSISPKDTIDSPVYNNVFSNIDKIIIEYNNAIKSLNNFRKNNFLVDIAKN